MKSKVPDGIKTKKQKRRSLLPFTFDISPSSDRNGAQYLEDLATAYWSSQVLFTAVEAGVFGLIERGSMDADGIARLLGFDASATGRFLDALCTLGLLGRHEPGGVPGTPLYFNTKVSSDFLVEGKAAYQGKAILWRRELFEHWSTLGECLKAGRRAKVPVEEGPDEQSRRIGKYLDAMDCAARVKAGEMMPLFDRLDLKGRMLDVGAGTGSIALAFLDRFPRLSAVLVDIPEVIPHTRRFVEERVIEGRAELRQANILEPWPFEPGSFSLVVLSNIIHAYSETELPHILASAASCLASDGLLVIHDLFFDHCPEKAALFDLNMLINTYNGRLFSANVVEEGLRKLGMRTTDLTPLAGDTALIAASREQGLLDSLAIDAKESLVAKVKALGFKKVLPIPTGEIEVADWVQAKCESGCDHYGSPRCPPNTPVPDATARLLKDYSFALLLEGEPPTREFQRAMLAAEREAFIAGHYKALALWAGPCSLCPTCATDGRCRNRKESRASMEGVGIDVFATVRGMGLSLATLSRKDQYVKYFGLLLVE